ncbi:ABC transporter substrate-binding protein [Streptomyces sp. NBC_01614]|uniref:ABC transporter substrate-binding protein n=1 Tax=Streptomyces sp. NBC_00180 TaxID=2903632 RepID=A0AAU1ID14_9ACTN
MNRRRRVSAVLIAFALTVAGCSAGAGEPPTPGVTAATITIGSHADLTGVSSPGLKEIPPAAKAYFDYVNDHGGVYGRKIIYDYRDDNYRPANALTVVQQLVEQNKVFAIFNGAGTAPHQAVAGYLNAQKVPDLFPSTGWSGWNDPAKLPNTFAWALSYRAEAKILATYVEKTFPGKKIAYFYQGTASGKDFVAGLDTVIPASQVVAREAAQPTYDGINAQVRAIAQAKADVIIGAIVPAYWALLRRAQEQIGNTAQLVINSNASDPTNLSRLMGPALMQGIITDVYLPQVTDTSNSWVALAKRIHDRYLPNAPFGQNFLYGVANAYSFVEALQRAGKNLTRQSLVTALEQGGPVPGFGLVPLDYSRTSHAGYSGAQIGVIKGNTIALEGRPMTTDDGNGPVVPYTAPQPPAPADGIPAP